MQQDRAGVGHGGKSDADLHAIRPADTAGGRSGAAFDRRRASCAMASMASPGSSAAATISMSPTVSSARRSRPGHLAPSARQAPIGSARGSGRRWRPRVPAECAESIVEGSGNAASMARSTASSRPGIDAHGVRLHRIDQIGERGDAEPFVQERQLFERDRARLVQPPQIRRQIGDGRFHQHPGAGFVELPQPLEHLRVCVGRRVQRTAVRESASESICRARTSSRRAPAAAARPGRRGCEPTMPAR